MNYQEFIQEFNRRKEEELRKREELVGEMKASIYQKVYNNLDNYLNSCVKRSLKALSLEPLRVRDYHILNIDEGLLSLEEHRIIFESVVQSLSDKWVFQQGFNVEFKIEEERSKQDVHVGHRIEATIDLSSPREDVLSDDNPLSQEELFVLLAALMTFS